MSPPRASGAWELILDGDGAPATNMAKDAWLMERAGATGKPVLRLYGWNGFAVSLGRTQHPGRDVSLAACAAEGIPLVRRATGGRAVLHGSDLTYAVCAPADRPPFQGGILAVYREISRAFTALLIRLGLDPQVKAYTGRQRAGLASPICFSTPSAFEILVGGKKLVGSAQRLAGGSFLQHGSLPQAPQHRLLARLFRGASAEDVAAAMTDLETLGVMPPLSPAQLREAVVAAFAETFAVDFVPISWNESDEAEVEARLGKFAPLPFQADGAPPPPRPPPDDPLFPAASQ